MKKLEDIKSVRQELFYMGQKLGVFIPKKNVIAVKFNLKNNTTVDVKRMRHIVTREPILGSGIVFVTPNFFTLNEVKQEVALTSAVDKIIKIITSDLKS